MKHKKERAPRQESPSKEQSVREQAIADRLVKQELGLLSKAVTRYARRAVAVARDIESFSRSRSAAEFSNLETHFLKTIESLEEKVGRHAR